MTSAIAQLPQDVQDALNREKAYLDQRPKGGKGGRDWDFDKLEAPEAVSQSKVHHRVFLPAALPMAGLPWKCIPQHTVTAQGNTTSKTCPHRYALAVDPKGAQGAPPPCPICEAAEWLKESARNYPRDSPENKEAWDRGVKLSARERYFANTVDLDNLARHWKQNESGSTDIVPCVCAFGTELVDGLKAVMGECGMFWHPQGLTQLKITTTRTGKLDFNVERDVRMVLPAGGFNLDAVAGAGVINYMLANLNDLNGMVTLLPYDQLKSFIPAYARPNVQVAVPASPHAQAMPPAAPMSMPPIPSMAPPPAAQVLSPSPSMTASSLPPIPMAAVAPPPMPAVPAMPPVPPIPAAAQPPPPPAPAAAAPPAPPAMPPLPTLPPVPGVPSVAAPAQMPPPPSSPSSPPPMPAMPPLPPVPRIG